MTNPRNPYTAEDIARIEKLVAEGVPLTWIAEDLGRSAASVQGKVSDLGLDVQTGWGKVWPTILHRQELLELHQEFAPRSRHAW